MTEEGVVIPGEGTGHDAGPERVNQAITEKAKKDGWRPLEEWSGDMADWVDAKEFNGRKSLFEKIGSLKSELQSQRRSFDTDMNAIKIYVQQMSKIEYEKALKDLKSERRDAIAERDVDTVEAIDKQIETVEKQRAIQPPVTNVQAEDTQRQFIEWQAKEGWYKSDPDLKVEADALGIGYGSKHQNATAEQVFDYVSKNIRKLFPEKFEGEKKLEIKKPAANVEAGGTSRNPDLTSKGDKFTEADLTPKQKDIMGTLVKRGVLTKDQYIKQLGDALTENHRDFSEYNTKKA